MIEILKLIKNSKLAQVIETDTSNKNIFIFSFGVIAGIAPFGLYLFGHDAAEEAYRQTTEYTATMKSLWFYIFPMKELFSLNLLAIYKFIGVVLPFVFYSLILLMIVMIAFSKKINGKDFNLFIVFIFGCMTLNQTISYPGISRISQILPPALISNVYLIGRYVNNPLKKYSQKQGLLYKISLAGLNISLFIFIAASCVISDPYINGSIVMRIFNKTFLPDPKLQVYTQSKDADEFNSAVEIIKNLSKVDEYIFTFPNNSLMFHFVTGRKSFEKYAIIPEYLKSKNRQEKVIRLLEERNVRLIISDLTEEKKRILWAPIVDEYIMKYYEPVQKAGTYTFFARKY
ncbi:MAG: hypothetical protein HY761_05465 [Candidatus Omnitrophica bacterium]|nr:hypothetical protein [Candidatus Omnitrophota bacterium]